jgi:hypothetical protein
MACVRAEAGKRAGAAESARELQKAQFRQRDKGPADSQAPTPMEYGEHIRT